jgi:hypothetical protein
MTAAITWSSSADIGITRSRSVFEGATTSRPMSSPFGRSYWRMLSWLSSRNSSIRSPVCRRVSMQAQVQNAASSASVRFVSSPETVSFTRTWICPRVTICRSCSVSVR